MAILRGCLSVIGLAMLTAALAADDDPPASRSGRDESGKPGALPKPAEARPGEKKMAALENLKLPPGAVVVICDDAKDALRLVPKAVVLTPEKFQELLEQIEQLKRQLKPEKPESPSSCKLTGKVDGDLVHLRAQYGFRTERPRALVALGGARAWATAGSLADGSLPVLLPAEEGLVTQVGTPGAHQLTLDWVLPVTGRGGKGLERGFELSMPRAAITTVEALDFPGEVADVRINGRSVRTRREASKGHTRLEGVPIGPVEKLDLTWKGLGTSPQKGQPLLAARGKVIVRVTEGQVQSEVELTLEVIRGETDQWRVLLPVPMQASLEVTKPQPADERIRAIQLPDRQNPVLTIRLKELSAEPLQVVVQVRQPRGGGPIPIGPFTVLDAFPQRGTIEVRAPADLRVRAQVRAEASPREISEEQRREGTMASFSYWVGQPPSSATTVPPAPITLDVEAVKGAVEARIAHTLRRPDSPTPTPIGGGREGKGGWRLATKVDLTPVRTAVDRLEVVVPAGWRFERDVGATPADLVEDVVLDATGRLATVKLAQRLSRPFALTLPWSSLPPRADSKSPDHEEVALELPRLLGWSVERIGESDRPASGAPPTVPVLDRGGQLTVIVPEGMELLSGPVRGERPAPGVREVTWSSDRAPTRVDLLLQVQHAELTVASMSDVTVEEQQLRVRQRLHYQFPQALPNQVELQIPAGLRGRVKVTEGGKGTAGEGRSTADASLLQVNLTTDGPAPADGLTHVLTLEYLVPLAPGERPETRRFDLPFVKPDRSTRSESRVRAWSLPGTRTLLAAGAWEEQRTEAVAERDAFPDLVLRGSLSDPLALRTESVSGSLSGTIVERVLVQATVTPGAAPAYRVRFLLRKLQGPYLELSLPGFLAQPNVDVRLDGKRLPLLPQPEAPAGEVSQALVGEEPGHPAQAGRLVRLRVEPELYPRPVILEVRCQAEPGSVTSDWLRTCLQPPMLAKSILLGRVRWQIEAPPGWLLLNSGGGATLEQQWGRRGWLLGPQAAATTSELERWLSDAALSPSEENGDPTLVCWSAVQRPLSVVQVPQQAWLLVCSLATLGLGLLLACVPLPRLLFWSVVILSAAGLIVVGITVPGILSPLAYGCEPGMVVLVLVLMMQWLLHQRYRRQVVFLPGFTRRKAGSSMLRSGSSSRRRVAALPREPSTVDEPAKSGDPPGVELR